MYDQDDLMAVQYAEIPSGGTVDGLLLKEPDEHNEWQPSGDTWVASGGVTYDAYIYTTSHDDLDYDSTSKLGSPYPYQIDVDGNLSLSFDYENDLVEATTLTVSVTEIPENGEDPFQHFYALVFEEGEEELGPDTAVAANNVEIDEETEAELIMHSGPEEGVWLGTPGETYQVVLLLLRSDTSDGPESDGSRHLLVDYTHVGHMQPAEAFDDNTWGDPDDLQF